MAEEIVASWSQIAELIAELVSGEDSERKTRNRVHETSEPLRMEFQLRDGTGQPVVWPLVLISDTTRRRESHG